MRALSGLVILLLFVSVFYAGIGSFFSSLALVPSPGARRTPETSQPPKVVVPFGQWTHLHAEFGTNLLSKTSSQARIPDSLSYTDHDSRDKSMSSSHSLSHRHEVAGLTNLHDQSWNDVGLRKMRKRTPMFGLGVNIHSNSPASVHLNRLALDPSSPILHFAVDAVREPCTSAARVIKEYTLLAMKEAGDSVDSAPKPRVSSRESSSNSRGSSRIGSGKRARGGRRLPARVDH
ncbi:hypothetical protein DL93DRAFT_1421225 [Clavulina sp. PMI_390]|nr:hypothetical protein DL93DRAFT_1421225 [Clavulina sp. PMI_390]